MRPGRSKISTGLLSASTFAESFASSSSAHVRVCWSKMSLRPEDEYPVLFSCRPFHPWPGATSAALWHSEPAADFNVRLKSQRHPHGIGKPDPAELGAGAGRVFCRKASPSPALPLNACNWVFWRGSRILWNRPHIFDYRREFCLRCGR